MENFDEKNSKGINYRFLMFVVSLIFIIYPLAISVDKFMKLDVGLLFIGLVVAILICIGFVLFGIEKKLFAFLKKSVFSKYFITVVVVGYMVSVGLMNYQTQQRLGTTNTYSDIKDDFKDVKFISSLQNALLLKNIVIVDIQNSIKVEDVKSIIKKYSNRGDLAFRFKLNGETENSYTVYGSSFIDITISLILLYFLLAVLIWGLDWSHRPSSTKFGLVKELIGVFVVVLLYGLLMPPQGESYWGNNFFKKDNFLLSSYRNNQYLLVFKGVEDELSN